MSHCTLGEKSRPVCVCVCVCASSPAGRDPTCYHPFSWRQIHWLVKEVRRESDSISHSCLSSYSSLSPSCLQHSLFLSYCHPLKCHRETKGEKCVCARERSALRVCTLVRSAIVISENSTVCKLRCIFRGAKTCIYCDAAGLTFIYFSPLLSGCRVDRWRDGGTEWWRRREMPREGTMRRRRLKQAA